MMRELTASSHATLLKRIDGGVEAMLQQTEVIDPETISMRISVQDTLRGYDWIDLRFMITAVSDARLVDANKQAFLDSSDGITVMFENGLCAVAFGRYNTIDTLKTAQLYVIGGGIRYEELVFGGS